MSKQNTPYNQQELTAIGICLAEMFNLKHGGEGLYLLNDGWGTTTAAGLARVIERLGEEIQEREIHKTLKLHLEGR